MRSPVPAALVALAVGALGCATAEPPRRAALVAAPAPAPLPAASRGSLGSTAVGRFVRERNAQLQFCYEDARTADAALAGTIAVAVTLDDAGRVAASDIARRSWSGDGGAVERCVLATVRRWRFPAPEADDARAHSFVVVFTPAVATSDAR